MKTFVGLMIFFVASASFGFASESCVSGKCFKAVATVATAPVRAVEATVDTVLEAAPLQRVASATQSVAQTTVSAVKRPVGRVTRATATVMRQPLRLFCR